MTPAPPSPVQGRQWVRLEVVGQSFMMHQIRRMVGMALAEFRGAAPPGSLELALNAQRVMDVRSRPLCFWGRGLLGVDRFDGLVSGTVGRVVEVRASI